MGNKYYYLIGVLLAAVLSCGGCSNKNGAEAEAQDGLKATVAPETSAAVQTAELPVEARDYARDVYSPLHFQPAIAAAKDEDCLACHKEILDDKVRETSPAGLASATALAWYQTLSTYSGDQAMFHQRHLTTPYAQKVMNLKCNTCHQGHEPRDEAPGTSATATPSTTKDFTLRKQVNVETICLRCHGQMPWQNMTGLIGPWPTVREDWGNNCLACHAVFRTVRHQVNYLHPEAIEEEAAKSGDACYGCHGGRSWYRINFPYPRHNWEGMDPEVPEWAKDRPTESEARFMVGVKAPAVPAPDPAALAATETKSAP